MRISRLASAAGVASMMPIAYAHEPYNITTPSTAAASPTDAALTVIGEKSSRSLHNTPTSVTILTSRAIDRQGLISTYDILDRIPNVTVDGSRTTFSIRGVDAFNVSGGGEGALASAFVDGVAIPRLAMASGPLDLYDVQQVELLRGPQSTVLGRNTLAGAVIINTADPDFNWTGKARLLLTDQDGQRRVGAVIGGPIADGDLAFRLVSETSQSTGLIHNITTSGDADRQRSNMVRGKLLLIPRALPGLRLVGGFLDDRHRRGTFYTEFDPPYDPSERIATSDVQDIKRVTSSIGTLSVEYEIGPGSILKSVTNYSHIRFRSLSDADRTAMPGQVSRIDDPHKTFQQEVRFHFHRSWVEGLIGAYYLREQRAYSYKATQNLSLLYLGVDRQLRAAGLPPATVAAILNLYGGVLPINNDLSQSNATENYAGFADLTFRLGNQLHLRFGLRYDSETQGQNATQRIAINRPLPDPMDLGVPALAPVVGQLNTLLRDLVQGASSTEPARSVHYQAWLPKLGLTYDVTSNIGLSLTVQRGYRAGGCGFNEQRAESYDFEPEHITNYEWAVRSTWFQNRVTLNANLYRTDWKDQQVLIQLTPGALYDTKVVNAGKSRLYGFEMEASGVVTRMFSLYAGIGFGSARFRDFFVEQGTLTENAQGKDFPRAPRWTFSGGATFSHPGGWFANLNANHRGAYFQNIIDQSVRDIPARTLVNAKLGWQGSHFAAFLIASNIFDVQKPDQFFRDVDGRRRGSLNDPRIMGLSFEGRI